MTHNDIDGVFTKASIGGFGMLLLPQFEYHEPSTLEEACQLMAQLKDKARPLAGGTDLLVNMKKGNIRPENVISLDRIPDLKERGPSDGQWQLGACTIVTELAEDADLEAPFYGLTVAAKGLGSPLIRNLATIGGNLATARPAADLPPPLMAHGAKVVLKKAGGERLVLLKDFFKGPGETVMAPDEILSQVILEKPPPLSGSHYIKLGLRKALEISLVNVAAFLSLKAGDGTIASARVVLGAVAPVPMRASSAEEVLIDQRPDESLFSEAGEAAARDSRPIDDHRGSAAYRRDMVKVLTKRCLSMALSRARESRQEESH
jgi:carbon-monoxide dehydrogenase medium subunit